MLRPQFALAAACVAIGFLPALVLAAGPARVRRGRSRTGVRRRFGRRCAHTHHACTWRHRGTAGRLGAAPLGWPADRLRHPVADVGVRVRGHHAAHAVHGFFLCRATACCLPTGGGSPDPAHERHVSKHTPAIPCLRRSCGRAGGACVCWPRRIRPDSAQPPVRVPDVHRTDVWLRCCSTCCVGGERSVNGSSLATFAVVLLVAPPSPASSSRQKRFWRVAGARPSCSSTTTLRSCFGRALSTARRPPGCFAADRSSCSSRSLPRCRFLPLDGQDAPVQIRGRPDRVCRAARAGPLRAGARGAGHGFELRGDGREPRGGFRKLRRACALPLLHRAGARYRRALDRGHAGRAR